MSVPAPSRPEAPHSSQDAPPSVAAGVSGVAAAIVSWGLAGCQVILDRGFEAGDLAPFAFWSGLFGVVTVGVSRALSAVRSHVGLTARYFIGVVAGAFAAVGFTVFVSASLGPWVGGFGFPILTYWAIGGVAGQCLAVRMTQDDA
jgi:hypothetical protein